MDYISIPKVELHCHLDGSLDVDTTLELLKNQGRNYTKDDLVKEMTVEPGCTSLAEYLQKFDLPISVMQTEEELERCAYGVAKNAAADGVKYLETRFAPQFHRQKGLNYRQIIESVQRGLDKAKNDTGIETGIIVCAMRHMSDEENIEMFRAAREFFGAGVVAGDLAGGEVGNPVCNYGALFDELKKLEMPYTIHGGEQREAANVSGAIEFGASRVGHGIAAMQDETIMKMAKENDILFEMCPTSNLQTKAVEDLSNYPILKFMEYGIKISLNTDNRTVSGITLSDDYKLIADTFKLTETDFKKIYKDAVAKSFAPETVKSLLLNMQ